MARFSPPVKPSTNLTMSFSYGMMTLILCTGNLVLSETVKEALRNKHLTIACDLWEPFVRFNFSEYSNATTIPKVDADGIMLDLLLFMQKARNFTFTLVKNVDYDWGDCYGVNDCDGMLGMVNRKEVDFALGIYDNW